MIFWETAAVPDAPNLVADNPTTAEADTLDGEIAESTVITVAGEDGVVGTILSIT